MVVFLFKQKTAYEVRIRDWSSDVCSSDLRCPPHSRAGEPDPVIFLEPKRLYNGPFDGHHERPVTSWAGHPLGDVPEDHYSVPLGKAVVRRQGSAATILAYGTMVHVAERSEEHTSELQSLMRISYAVFCLKKKKKAIYYE